MLPLVLLENGALLARLLAKIVLSATSVPPPPNRQFAVLRALTPRPSILKPAPSVQPPHSAPTPPLPLLSVLKATTVTQAPLTALSVPLAVGVQAASKQPAQPALTLYLGSHLVRAANQATSAVSLLTTNVHLALMSRADPV